MGHNIQRCVVRCLGFILPKLKWQNWEQICQQNYEEAFAVYRERVAQDIAGGLWLKVIAHALRACLTLAARDTGWPRSTQAKSSRFIATCQTLTRILLSWTLVR